MEDILKQVIDLINLARTDLKPKENIFLLQNQHGKILDYVVCSDLYIVRNKAKELRKYDDNIFALNISEIKLDGRSSFLAYSDYLDS